MPLRLTQKCARPSIPPPRRLLTHFQRRFRRARFSTDRGAGRHTWHAANGQHSRSAVAQRSRALAASGAPICRRTLRRYVVAPQDGRSLTMLTMGVALHQRTGIGERVRNGRDRQLVGFILRSPLAVAAPRALTSGHDALRSWLRATRISRCLGEGTSSTSRHEFTERAQITQSQPLHHMGTLKRCYRWQCRRGALAGNPCDLVPTCPRRALLPAYADWKAQVEALLDAPVG